MSHAFTKQDVFDIAAEMERISSDWPQSTREEVADMVRCIREVTDGHDQGLARIALSIVQMEIALKDPDRPDL